MSELAYKSPSRPSLKVALRYAILDRPLDRYDLYFAILFLLANAILIALISQLSISYNEAYSLYYGGIKGLAPLASIDGVGELFSRLEIPFLAKGALAHYMMLAGLNLLGHNIYGLHFVFLLLFSINLLLFYLISRLYMRNGKYAIITTLTFALLPGVNITAFMASKAIAVLFIALVCSYISLRFGYVPYILLFLFCVVDSSLAILYLAYMVYSIRHKKAKTFVFCLVGFFINIYLFELGIRGVPRNYFLEALYDMLLLFSPLFFIYYIYSLYHTIFRAKSNILVYIASICIVFSLLISLRQRVDFETMLPMSIVALPVCMDLLLGSIYLRLPAFRRGYLLLFYTMLALMVIEIGLLFNSRALFLIGKTPSFTMTHYDARDIARTLKRRGIDAVHTNRSMALRLRFYGIKSGGNLSLVKLGQRTKGIDGDIKIHYLGHTIGRYRLLRRDG